MTAAILFTQFLDGIYRVSADGGTPKRVTQVDKAKRELNHYWPEFLPDGQHFLYMATALEPSGLRATPTVYVASLDSRETTRLTQIHSRMAYASPGYLLFVQEGALLAQAFDTVKLRLMGEPVRIADGLAYVRTLGNGAFTVSANGTLAYQGAGDTSQIRWYDRRGNVTDVTWPKQNYGSLRFSRDGQSVAVDVDHPRTGTADIWIFDTSRGTPIRFTSDPADESGPVWSPDDGRILFRTVRGGPESLRMGSAAPNLHAKAVATGIEEPLVSDRKSARNKRLVSGRPMDHLHQEHETNGQRSVAETSGRRWESAPLLERTVRRIRCRLFARLAMGRVRLDRIWAAGSVRRPCPATRPTKAYFDWRRHHAAMEPRWQRAVLRVRR